MAEVEVGELIVRLRADLSSLQSDVQKMQRTFESGTSGMVRTAIVAGRNIASALGVGFSAALFVNFIRGIIDTNDRLSDLADQTGFSAGALSGLRATVENAGLSIDTFARGIQLSQRVLGNLDDEGGKAAAAMKALGLNINEMKKLAPEEFFKRAIKGIAEFGDQNSRAALLTAVFSRSGLQLLGVVDQLAENFDELKKSGLNDETVRNLGRLSDELHTFGIQLQNVAAGPLANFIEGMRLFFGAMTPKEDLLFKLATLEDKLVDIDSQIRKMTTGNVFQKFLSGLKFDIPTQAFQTQSGQTLEDLQRARKETLDAVNEIARQINEAQKPPAAGAKKTFVSGAEEDAKKIKALTESLQKQVVALKAEQIELDQGAAAGLRFRLTQDAMLEVGKNLPPNIRALIEEIVNLSKSMEALKVSERVLASFAPLFAKIDEEQERAIQGGQEFAAIMRQLAFDVLDPLSQEIVENDQRFDDLRLKMLAAAEAAGKTEEEIAALEQRLRSLKAVGAIKLSVDAEDMDRLLKTKEANEFSDSLGKIAEKMEDARQLSVALGDPFATLSEQISLAREKVELLTKEFGALSPQVRDAVAELDRLTNIQVSIEGFKDIAGSLSRGIRETVIGIQRGEQELGDGLKNMFRNAAISLQEAILDKTIFKPFEAFLEGFFQGLLGAFTDASNKAAKDFGNQLGTMLKNVISQATQNIQLPSISGGGGGGSFLGGFGSFFSSIFSWITSFFFQEGGPVISSSQIVPAFLHQGEFVLKKSAVDAIGVNTLSRANRDLRLPGFQFGGYVSPSTFSVPSFQSGGAVGANMGIRANQPVTVQLVQDFTNAVAPSDLKTGKREVKEFLLQEMANSHVFRVALREAVRK